MTITCAGDVTAGGLVGKAESATISECWSGTDVEIKDSTESSNITLGESSGKLAKTQQKVQIFQLKKMFLMDVSLLPQTIIQTQSMQAELLVKRLLKTKIAMQSKITRPSQVLKFVVMQPAKMLTRSTLLWETVIPA